MSTTGESPRKLKPKPPKDKKSQVKSNDRLKIIVRRLPPNLPEEVFWQSVQEWVTDQTVSWKAFYGGKFKKRLNKENIPSRAYLAFKNEEDLAVFSKAYDGHLFRDKSGNESQAVVEFAPYQKVPPEKGKADNRIATIEADEDYISFVESLKAEASKPFDVDTLETLIASTQPPPEPKTTPLIEALIAEKSAQRDKEAILRNHAHYKDQSVLNGPGSKREDKKKGSSSGPPSSKPGGGDQGKKAAKKAAQKAHKGPPYAQAGASSKNTLVVPPPAPTIMSKPNAAQNAAGKSPSRASRPPKPAVAAGGDVSNSQASSTTVPAVPSSPAPTAVTLDAPAPTRRARPMIGMASRQFEAALTGAGVKSRRGGKQKEKEDNTTTADGKSPSAAAKEENINVKIDVPTILAKSLDAVPVPGSGRGTGRGRGRGRGRGSHRGGG